MVGEKLEVWDGDITSAIPTVVGGVHVLTTPHQDSRTKFYIAPWSYVR